MLNTMASPYSKRENPEFHNATAEDPWVAIYESINPSSRDMGDLNSVLARFLHYRSRTSQHNEEQCSPISRQMVSPQLPSIQINNPVSTAPELLCLSNQLELSLEQEILLSYTRYKTLDSSMGSSSSSYIQYLHSMVCTSNCCLCDRLVLLVSHFDGCNNAGCNLCGPVRDLFVTTRSSRQNFYNINYGLQENNHAHFGGPGWPPLSRGWKPCSRFSENGFVSLKCMRLDDSLNCASENGVASASVPWMVPHCLSEGPPPLQQWPTSPASVVEAKLGPSSNPKSNCTINPKTNCTTVDQIGNNCDLAKGREIPSEELKSEEVFRSIRETDSTVVDDLDQLMFNSMDVDSEELHNASREMPVIPKNGWNKTDIDEEIKQGDPKTVGVSLLECLTIEEVKEHISSLQMSVDLRTMNEEKGDIMVHSNGDTCQSTPMLSENECQLCRADELLFALPPMYCSGCGARIKHKKTYYTTSDDTDVSNSFCSTCYRLPRGACLKIGLHKKNLVKKKNDDQKKEPWVQCDSCKQWQHQICGLYNHERDVGEKIEYKCPKCLAKEIEAGERVPLTKAAFLGSKDLPKCGLSDFLEQRLFRRLQQERKERAEIQAKSYDEVPAAEGLVVRVVVSVNKQLEVKPQILDIFGEKYPAEIPFRSKVILLFQKIGGVDVCLFGMYVQEFGSDCICPNQRCVYISYLDSVKYFRPETSTSAGEALRTFVYHEILIGYLEYCKKRGFVSCYLWACPPVKGEDFIFYCHPKTQMTPESANLRKWYYTMLGKAADEKIVVNITNLYDEFFVTTEQCASKTTAARLPYFGDDCWGGLAEKVIKDFELKSGRDPPGKEKKRLTKRTLKAMGHPDMAYGVTKDALFMQKLGQTIQPAKENFIVVRLQFDCSLCHEVILSGSCWSCTQCKSFQLCRRCLVPDQRSTGENTHTLNGKEHHLLEEVMVDEVPTDIAEEDEILENWLFANRHIFLSVCQSHHYQFDTLRRAKYSSMMILHHLGHKSMPTVFPSCKICHQRSDSRNRDVCAACSPGASLEKELLDILLHASQCRPAYGEPCSLPKCLLMKRLFHHATKCTTGVQAGCPHCEKVWYLLKLHSRGCTQADCCIPRCKDLSKHTGIIRESLL